MKIKFLTQPTPRLLKIISRYYLLLLLLLLFSCSNINTSLGSIMHGWKISEKVWNCLKSYLHKRIIKLGRLQALDLLAEHQDKNLN